MKKRWIRVVLAAAVLVIVVLGLIPFFVNADTFRPKIQDELSSGVGRKVTLGHIGLSLFTGSLVAENISIADDPAFASTPFLEAKELRIGVELGPLIFHHSVQITTFTVDFRPYSSFTRPTAHGTSPRWAAAPLSRNRSRRARRLRSRWTS